MIVFLSMAYERLINLVRKFDAGVIELPLMQRDYVWPSAKVVSLLDSLYRGWPIGIFYSWQTASRQHTRAAAVDHRVGAKIAQPFWGYLLDGQQRLTSLSRALEERDAGNLATRAFFDVRKSVFVMGEHTKTIEKRIALEDPTLIELSRLIPKADGSAVEREKEREKTFQEILDKLIDKGVISDTADAKAEYRIKLKTVATMLDMDAPCEDFKTGDTDDDLNNAIELFKRLNKGGKTVTRVPISGSARFPSLKTLGNARF